MKLVLIDNRNKVVKVYEENCTADQIDDIFTDYISIKRQQSKAAKCHTELVEVRGGSQSKADMRGGSTPTVQTQWPTITYVGPDLTNFLQGQLRLMYDEMKYEAELAKRANNVLATRAGIWWNKIKTGFLNFFNKKTKSNNVTSTSNP